MKITISKRDLEDAIQVATIGVSSGTDLSGHFLFRISGDKAEVLTYNQRIFVGSPLTCQIDEGADGDAFTVEGRKLRQWLGAVGDVAITLDGKDATVKATSPRGSVRWPSLDPNKFPFWDDILSASSEIAVIDTERLHAGLTYAKQFVSPEESTMPHLAVAEIRAPKDDAESALYATDQVGVAVVNIDGMESSKLRVHGKDIAALLSFLALKGSDKVEVWEHDRCLIVKRQDGSLFGVARPNNQFPPLDVAAEMDEKMWWEVDVADLESAIRFLVPSAAKDDTRMRLRFDAGQKSVIASVVSEAGGEDELPIKTVGFDGVDQLPSGGFMLRHPYLTKITSQFENTTLRFSIFQKKKGGWVRFQHEKGGDKYLTVVVWVI
jgi:DNA polymerase III sliding clamp (beta) subunit (PCNA family)